MRSRMDRYRENTNDTTNHSRSLKNEDLYRNLGNNTKYTNFTDVSSLDAVSLSDASKKRNTREGYQQIKKYDDLIEVPKVKRDLDEFNHLYQDHENRVYDINSVLEEARRNRQQKDELEEKRKLKNTNYNILAELNKEELERYRQEKQEVTAPDEEELKDLINTITSKTLAGEISKQTSLDLLSDLMETRATDKEDIKKQEVDDKLSLSKEILDKDTVGVAEAAAKKNPASRMLQDMDNSFYTRSMDLSDKDFEMDDEFSEGMKEGGIPTAVKVLLIIVLIAVVGVAVYFVIQNF